MHHSHFSPWVVLPVFGLFLWSFAETVVSMEPVSIVSIETPKEKNDEFIEIGGVVLDQRGQPIPKAVLEVSYRFPAVREEHQKKEPQVPVSFGYETLRNLKTDEQGKWTAPVAKEIESVELVIWPPGNDHRKTWVKRPNPDALKSKNHKARMKDAFVLEGYVYDPEGRALRGAHVCCQSIFTLPVHFLYEGYAQTDDRGYFRMQSSEPGQVHFGVFSKNYAPMVKSAEFEEKQPSLDFRLEPGKRVKIQVLDREGNFFNEPVFSVRIHGEMFFFYPSVHTEHIENRLSAIESVEQSSPFTSRPGIDQIFTPVKKGTWELVVPESTPMELGCRVDSANGEENYMGSEISSEELLAFTGDSPFPIMMDRILRIGGKVFDASSGETITDYRIYGYEKIPDPKSESGKERIQWNGEFSLEKEKDAESAYLCTFRYVQKNYHLKVEAKGYKPAISPAFFPFQGRIEYDFNLSKDDGGPPGEAARVGSPDERIKQWDQERDLIVF